MPGKQWEVVPAWKRVKDEILDARQHCLYWLGKYRQQPNNTATLRSFVVATVHYYNVLKPKIKKHCKAIPKVFTQLDQMNGIPAVPRADAWIKIFYKIDDICEEIGVPKIEMEKEREYPPEEAWKEGLEVDVD